MLGVVALGAGGSSQQRFAASAREACEERDLRLAKRTYHASNRKGLTYERDLLQATLTDLRKIEPPEKARDEWAQLAKIHTKAIRDVDRA